MARGGYRPSDLCVSAPTGSGKTLAFVIPVVQVSVRTAVLGEGLGRQGTGSAEAGGCPHPTPQALLCRAVCQVRALVVLPTKELAQQVCAPHALKSDSGSLSLWCSVPGR